MAEAQLAVNATHIVHETIDGETIVIHLVTGTYYSFDGAGTSLWPLVVRGASRSELVATAQARYAADPDEVAEAIEAFLTELIDEDLLTEADAAGAGAPSTSPEGDRRDDFVAPVLHKYDDLQDFMMVDPLHDVDEDAGWPHARAG